MFASLRSRTVAVALSGGVDSLCALLLLKKARISVFAVHALFLPDAGRQPRLARLGEICTSLGVELLVAQLQTQFASEIIEPFCAACANGLTPNPCAWCNRKIKFGLLAQFAAQHGAARLATGHYAALTANPYAGGEGQLLAEAADSRKDQSYFLSLLSPAQIDLAVFPLARLNKTECRAIVAATGLSAPEAGESQDICFSRERLAMLQGQAPGPIHLALGADPRPGPLLGEHRGLARYTIGQRQGLGIPYAEPLYVLAKIPRDNMLLVGPKRALGQSLVPLSPVSMHVPPKLWPKRLLARLRYRSPLLPCSASIQDGKIMLRLDARFPAAPGQVGAVHDPLGRILASGIIAERAGAGRV